MTIFNALTLVGGLCLFLLGMNLMGQALERRAGGRLRTLLDKMTSRVMLGFLTGLGVTAIIQSSSATTVMVVGFVNSGLMTLRQAINVIMGANVGTTVTAWFLSLAGIAAFHRTCGDETERFAQQKAYLEQIYGARVALLENPDVVEISSTELRVQLAQGRGRSFLTEAVYGYVLRRGLYGTHADLKHLTPEELRPIALSFLKPKRMPHVLGTEHEAAVLARRYGADVTSARIAALLHDCTKKLSMEEQLALCEQYGIALDELERKNLKLLHAKTGAAIARDLFGVSDEIYWAIYWHTTGKADMTKLEKVIYLADYIEPSRDFPGVEKLRRAVHADLEHGLLMALEDSIEEMRQRGNPVHPNTVEARDYLLRGKNQ